VRETELFREGGICTVIQRLQSGMRPAFLLEGDGMSEECFVGGSNRCIARHLLMTIKRFSNLGC